MENGCITQCLRDWEKGDPAKALNNLMTIAYGDLQRLARTFLRREKQSHMLQPSALVHEIYLLLSNEPCCPGKSRAQFFGVAAQTMRRVLASEARERKRTKRGGNYEPVDLDPMLIAGCSRPREWMAVDEALDQLAKVYPQQAQVVVLRYFGGLSNDEIARLLNISTPTVTRRWRSARAWLYLHLINPGRPAIPSRREQALKK